MAARKSLEHRRGTGLAADKLRQVFSPRDEKLFPLQVGDLRVKQGDHVEAGALLMTLKTATGKTLAMRSPLAGSVTMIAAGAGDSLASPRVLVTIAEAGEDIVDGEWEDAPEPSSQGGSAGTARENATASRADPARGPSPDDTAQAGSAQGRGKRIAAAIAVLAVLIGGYAFFGKDLDPGMGAASVTRPAPQKKVASSNGNASSGRDSGKKQTVARTKPKVYDGPLAKEVMLRRDVGANPLGWSEDDRFVAHGQLGIKFTGGRIGSCEAVLLSDRYAVFSRLCYNPEYKTSTTLDAMTVTFRAFRAASQSDGRGGHQDIRGFWRVWEVDVAAIHYWTGKVDGSNTAIALAELVKPAPRGIGRAGYWRFTEKSAPPVLTLRNMSFQNPEKFYRRGVTCRYWLLENAERPTAEKPIPLRVDPNCEGAQEMVTGTFRVPYSNGNSYFAGFFQVRGQVDNRPFILAAGFSKGDERIIRGAKEGDVPSGAVTLRPMGRNKSHRYARILLSNPCKRDRHFFTIGVDKSSRDKRRIEYNAPAGKANWVKNPLGGKYDYFGLNEVGSRRGPGTRKFKFKNRTYHLVPFENDSDVKVMATASCN